MLQKDDFHILTLEWFELVPGGGLPSSYRTKPDHSAVLVCIFSVTWNKLWTQFYYTANWYTWPFCFEKVGYHGWNLTCIFFPYRNCTLILRCHTSVFPFKLTIYSSSWNLVFTEFASSGNNKIYPFRTR